MIDGMLAAFRIGCVLFLTFCLGAVAGAGAENTRLFNKCFTELQDKSYKEIISTCQERVKK